MALSSGRGKELLKAWGAAKCEEYIDECNEKNNCDQKQLDLCCSEFDVCPFYKAIWFYVLLAIILLLLISSIGIAVFCCIRKKRKNREGNLSATTSNN